MIRRTIVVKVTARDEQAYADLIATIAALPSVASWRASSMNAALMARLRRSGLGVRWMRGSVGDAVGRRR